MATDLITKDELLGNMRDSARTFLEAARAVPADRWNEGCYEEGWTAKDILAHVASQEWTFPKVLLLAEQGPAEAPPPEKHFRGGLGDYNQRQVAKRADSSVDDLVAEFERNRDATIGAVQEADEELLRVPVRSAGGVEGPAAEVLNYLTVVHLQQHLDDIRGAGA